MKIKNTSSRIASLAAMVSAMLMLNGFVAGCVSDGGSGVSDPTTPGQGTGLSGGGKGPSPVSLGKSGGFVILAKTGFSLLAPPGAYSTSALLTGKAFAADYASPTPANLTTAVADMLTGFTDAAGRAPDYTELGAGNLGGRTLAPAVYKWGTDILIPSDVTLSGGPNDVWIFQIAGNLTQSSGVKVVLSGGALAKNIFWQVSGAIVHETTAHFEGIELSQTAITYKTGATANGRLLAQTAVALDANAIIVPAP